MNATVCLARRQPLKTLLVLVFLLFAGRLLLALLPPLTAALLLALLAGNLSEFFLTTHYTFDEVGLQIRRGWLRHSYAWSRYVSFDLDRNGILLSPFGLRHPLENFRGTFLPLPREDRERLAPWLSCKLTRLP